MALTVQLVTTFAIWLWPLVKPGAEEFSKEVGKGLGEGFAGALKGLFGRIPAPASASEDELKNQIARLAQQDPPVVTEVASQAKRAVKELLWNNEFVTYPDLTIIAGNSGYTIGDFAPGPAAVRVMVVDQFVDQVWADGKAVKLIEEIRHQKEHLFSSQP